MNDNNIWAQQREQALQDLKIPLELYVTLIKGFIQELTQQLMTLDSATERKDYTIITSVAHTIKGTAGNLRLTSIADCAARIEHLILDDQYHEDDLKNELLQLHSCADQLKQNST